MISIFQNIFNFIFGLTLTPEMAFIALILLLILLSSLR